MAARKGDIFSEVIYLFNVLVLFYDEFYYKYNIFTIAWEEQTIGDCMVFAYSSLKGMGLSDIYFVATYIFTAGNVTSRITQQPRSWLEKPAIKLEFHLCKNNCHHSL